VTAAPRSLEPCAAPGRGHTSSTDEQAEVARMAPSDDSAPHSGTRCEVGIGRGGLLTARLAAQSLVSRSMTLQHSWTCSRSLVLVGRGAVA
jgi:hypothetical protein